MAVRHQVGCVRQRRFGTTQVVHVVLVTLPSAQVVPVLALDDSLMGDSGVVTRGHMVRTDTIEECRAHRQGEVVQRGEGVRLPFP